MMRRMFFALLTWLRVPCKTRQSGLWTDPATWRWRRVPRSGDRAVVCSGHTLTIDCDVTVGASETDPRQQGLKLADACDAERDGDLAFKPGSEHGRDVRWKS
jgi:hypothetical protein